MTPKRTFQVWLEEQITRRGTARELAVALKSDESKISRWRRNNLLPQSTEIEALASVTGTPIPELLLMLWDADRRRLESRLRPTSGGRRASLSPARVRRSAQALVLALGLGSGIWAYALPATVEARHDNGLSGRIPLRWRKAA